MLHPTQNLRTGRGGVVRPLERRSLADQAADALRDLILLEELAPGSVIPERETAEALGISRTPLREALRLLSAEGLVEVAPNQAPCVADPSLDEIQQLLQVQATLEALAGELACSEASDEELAKIAGIEAEMRRISDSAEPLVFFSRDMEFHSAIVASSGNLPLQETHATYNARLWRARFISSRRRVNRSKALNEHRSVAEALLARDKEAVAKALKSHLETGFANICKAKAESESGEKSNGKSGT